MNLGSINADEFAALIGGNVENSGSIISEEGAVGLLASDTTFEIGEASGGIISLDIRTLGGSATQDGLIDVSMKMGMEEKFWSRHLIPSLQLEQVLL